jgi:hypothetical protein
VDTEINVQLGSLTLKTSKLEMLDQVRGAVQRASGLADTRGARTYADHRSDARLCASLRRQVAALAVRQRQDHHTPAVRA